MNEEDRLFLLMMMEINWGQYLKPEFSGESPTPDWQTRKIDSACDYWELQFMGIRG